MHSSLDAHLYEINYISTTSPTFDFSVFESVRKTCGYERKLLSLFGPSSSCFLNSSKHLMNARFNLAVKRFLVFQGIFII
jgi:hypothetical protein